MDNHPRYRSLFWPILLVGVGIVWLLSNLGLIQQISLGSILKFWPVVLFV
ncbi:MAG: LiaI-LiaF-like domain-containing protein, partial [Anaerolineaceae bacterium]